MKTTKKRRNPRRPAQRSRQPRTHCDQCMRRMRKARKLSERKLWKLLARVPHIEAAKKVAEVMRERGFITEFRAVRGTLRVLPDEGNMKRAWPRR